METLALVLLLLGTALLISMCIFVLAKVDKTDSKKQSLLVTIMALCAMICFMYFSAITASYNQMRGNYKVTYKVDANMNVTDTIIHIR